MRERQPEGANESICLLCRKISIYWQSIDTTPSGLSCTLQRMASTHVHGQLAHFSINADDIERARKFYSAVFDWSFEPWGPPGFFMVSFPNPNPAPMLGSLQGRRELVPGVRMTGLECTFAVRDIDETVRLIEGNGGKIVMAKTTLPGVGHLSFFQDPEGNLAGAMQYDSEAR